MAEAAVLLLLIGAVAIVVGILGIVFARWVVVVERLPIILYWRLTHRKRRPGPISRRSVLATRLAFLAAATFGVYALCQVPLHFGKIPRDAAIGPDYLQMMMGAHAQILVSEGVTPGAAIGVIVGGRSATMGLGRIALGDKRTPNADTLFEIGSVTKTFTASVLAAMVDRGEVRLDDPVASLLPSSSAVPRNVKLVHLATHTSGLPRVADNAIGSLDIVTLSFITDPYARYSERDLRRFLTKWKQTAPPGTRCEYSNLGMGLLGYALSRKQGRSYEETLQREICRPLGMKSTTTTLSRDSRKHLAQGYYGLSVDGREVLGYAARAWRFQETNAGAGAVKSTVSDLLKYVRGNLGEGPPEVVRAMRATQAVQHRIDHRMSVCLGWHTMQRPGHDAPIIWHNGGTGGHSSFVGFCRKHSTGVVLLCNVSPSGEAIDSVALFLLDELCRSSRADADRAQH